MWAKWGRFLIFAVLCLLAFGKSGQEKNKKLNFWWPKLARLGPRFGPPESPEKVYVYVPLLRSFPGNEAHKLFSGGPNLGVLGGGQKVYVEKVYVLFPSLRKGVWQ